MNVLLVAIDGSEAHGGLLAGAEQCAAPLEADVVAVHVASNGSSGIARQAAANAGVPIFVRTGHIIDELVAAQQELHAVAVMTGGDANTPVAAAFARAVELEIVLEVEEGTVLVFPVQTRQPASLNPL